MRTCDLTYLVIYFNVKTHDIWEGSVTQGVRFKLPTSIP
jgi:hypothetical protein